MKTLRTRVLASLACASVLLALAPVASARPDPTPLDVSAISNVVNLTSLGNAIWTYGGAALVLAFTVGGGFIIAKKAYRWLMGKIG